MVETVLFIGLHWVRDMRVMDAWKRNGLTGGHHTHLSGLTKYNNYNAPSIGLNGCFHFEQRKECHLFLWKMSRVNPSIDVAV